MTTDLVDVLVKIAEGIHLNYSFNEILMSIYKNKDEYNENMVAAAYSWIYEKSLQNLSHFSEKDKQESGFRMLNENEINLIGRNNIKKIITLKNIGLLTNQDINKILNQLELIPEVFNRESNFDLLILSLFFDNGGKSIPGSRHVLYSSDTIN